WISIFIALGLLGLAIVSLRSRRLHEPVWTIGWVWIGFSLLVAVVIAFGRWSLGLRAAAVSRYHVYMAPMILGIYFLLCALPASKIKWGITAAYVLAFCVSEILGDAPYRASFQEIARQKMEWADCYRARHDVRFCSEQTGFLVYPKINEDLQAKLDFLQKYKLNLFKQEA